MLNETIETRGHTTKDGTLNLSIKVGAADADVAVIVQVRAVTPEDVWTRKDGPAIFLSALPDRCRICSVRLRAPLRIGLLLNDLSSRYQRVHYVAETARRSSNRTVEISQSNRYCSLLNHCLRIALRRSAKCGSDA